MMRIDRRSLLAGSAAGAGILMAAPVLARTGLPQPALFIYDARFEASRISAEQMAARGVFTLDPREKDLGIAWRNQIPQMLAKGNVSISGTTLWSDLFICESFGRDHGLSLRESSPLSEQIGGSAGLREWVLS